MVLSSRSDPGSWVPAVILAVVSWYIYKELERRTKEQRELEDERSKIAEELTRCARSKFRLVDGEEATVPWSAGGGWTAGSEKNPAAENSTTVLDIRDEESFYEAHLRASYNIPYDSLRDDNRWYELPEQHELLLVLLPSSSMDRHASIAKEFCDRRKPGATTFLVANRDFFKVAREGGILREGSPTLGGEGLRPLLFTPCPFLKRAAGRLESELREFGLPLSCVDIGCGSGRDSIWLANRGWKVTAVDCWDQALQKTARLAERIGVSECVEVLKGKIKHTGELEFLPGPAVKAQATETDPSAQGLLDDGRGGRVIGPSTPRSEFVTYGLVVSIRFLERAAFDTLAQLVDPRGGYLLLSTFVEEDTESRAPWQSLGTGRPSGNRRAGSPFTSFGDGSLGFGPIEEERLEGVLEKGTRVNGGGKESAHGAVKAKKKDGKVSGKEARAAISFAKEATARSILARWPHATPRDPNKILRRGELARYFGGRHGFEVVEDVVERLPDGRPVSCFLARRMPLVVSSPSSAGSSASRYWRRCSSDGTPATCRTLPSPAVREFDECYSPAKGFPNLPPGTAGPTEDHAEYPETRGDVEIPGDGKVAWEGVGVGPGSSWGESRGGGLASAFEAANG